MPVTAVFYPLGLKDALCGGTVQLQGQNMGAVLLTGYTVDQDNHRYLTSCMSKEIAASGGYTSLGATVTGSTVSYDAASNEIRWDFDDPTWTAASFSASSMVVYNRKSGGTTTSWEMLMYVEFGGTQTVTAGTFAYVVPVTTAGAITVA
jgi:hypothetical protein